MTRSANRLGTRSCKCRRTATFGSPGRETSCRDWGGDEFVVVAPDMSTERAAALASRMIQCIGQEPYRIGTFGPLRIGVSIGSASMPEDGLVGDDLHRKADAALHEAKAAGKGGNRHFTGSIIVPQPGGASTVGRRPVATDVSGERVDGLRCHVVAQLRQLVRVSRRSHFVRAIARSKPSNRCMLLDLFGMALVVDLAWIATFGAAGQAAPEISVALDGRS